MNIFTEVKTYPISFTHGRIWKVWTNMSYLRPSADMDLIKI